METNTKKHKITINKYNRLIIISPPCLIEPQTIEKLEQNYHIDKKNEYVSKADYESQFSVAITPLVPVKLLPQSYQNQHPQKKSLCLFINYNENIQHMIQTVQKYSSQNKQNNNNNQNDKNITPFLKAKNPEGILKTQLQNKLKFQQQNSINYKFLDNLIPQDSSQDQILELISDQINQCKNEIYTDYTNMLNILLVMSVPSSGKSTLSSNLKKFREKNQDQYYIGRISTDAIVSQAMKQILNSNNSENQTENQDENNINEELFEESDEEEKISDDQEIYYEALNQVKGLYPRILGSHFKKAYLSQKEHNFVFQDKNIVPQILNTAITDCFQIRKTREVVPLIRRVFILYPKVYKEENLIPGFPFTYGFVIQCLKRVLLRKNHDTLQGSEELKVAVVICFIQAYRGIPKFDENYFKEIKDTFIQNKQQQQIYHLPYPFTSEKAENNVQLSENDKDLIFQLINVEKQQKQEEIQQVPAVKYLLKLLESHQIEQNTEQEEQQLLLENLLTHITNI